MKIVIITIYLPQTVLTEYQQDRMGRNKGLCCKLSVGEDAELIFCKEFFHLAKISPAFVRLTHRDNNKQHSHL